VPIPLFQTDRQRQGDGGPRSPALLRSALQAAGVIARARFLGNASG